MRSSGWDLDQTAESKSELKTAEIASKARAYTMLISCMAKEKE
jgi:hypothetical protein